MKLIYKIFSLVLLLGSIGYAAAQTSVTASDLSPPIVLPGPIEIPSSGPVYLPPSTVPGVKPFITDSAAIPAPLPTTARPAPTGIQLRAPFTPSQPRIPSTDEYYSPVRPHSDTGTAYKLNIRNTSRRSTVALSVRAGGDPIFTPRISGPSTILPGGSSVIRLSYGVSRGFAYNQPLVKELLSQNLVYGRIFFDLITSQLSKQEKVEGGGEAERIDKQCREKLEEWLFDLLDKGGRSDPLLGKLKQGPGSEAYELIKLIAGDGTRTGAARDETGTLIMKEKLAKAAKLLSLTLPYAITNDTPISVFAGPKEGNKLELGGLATPGSDMEKDRLEFLAKASNLASINNILSEAMKKDADVGAIVGGATDGGLIITTTDARGRQNYSSEEKRKFPNLNKALDEIMKSAVANINLWTRANHPDQKLTAKPLCDPKLLKEVLEKLIKEKGDVINKEAAQSLLDAGLGNDPAVPTNDAFWNKGFQYQY